VGVHPHLDDWERSNCRAASRLGVRKGSSSLADRRAAPLRYRLRSIQLGSFPGDHDPWQSAQVESGDGAADWPYAGSPSASKMVELSDTCMSDQYLCSRSWSWPVNWRMVSH